MCKHHLSFCVVCPAPVGLYRAALIPLTLQHYAFSTLYSILFYAGTLFHIGILYCTDMPFHTSFFSTLSYLQAKTCLGIFFAKYTMQNDPDATQNDLLFYFIVKPKLCRSHNIKFTVHNQPQKVFFRFIFDFLKYFERIC